MAKPENQYQSTESYLMIPLRTLQSKEYKNLSYSARCIYFSMISQWRRNKPDQDIAISYSQIKTDLNSKSNLLVTSGIKQLIKCGFIKQTKKGGLEHNTSRYRLEPSWLLFRPKPINGNKLIKTHLK